MTKWQLGATFNFKTLFLRKLGFDFEDVYLIIIQFIVFQDKRDSILYLSTKSVGPFFSMQNSSNKIFRISSV